MAKSLHFFVNEFLRPLSDPKELHQIWIDDQTGDFFEFTDYFEDQCKTILMDPDGYLGIGDEEAKELAYLLQMVQEYDQLVVNRKKEPYEELILKDDDWKKIQQLAKRLLDKIIEST